MPRRSQSPPSTPVRHAERRAWHPTFRAAPLAPLALVAAVATGSVAACSRGESRPVLADSTSPSTPREPRPALGVVDAAVTRYVPRTVTDGGTITGTIIIAGDAPADTTVALDSIARRACPAPTLVDRTVARRGGRLADVAVWLTDVRTGKAMPLDRRHELRVDRCVLAPRIQGVAAGGTLNVRSSDALLTRLRFVRQPSGEVLKVIETNDAGQVVPDEQLLAAPGVVEVRGERQPWMRAYLVVVPHPYVTQSDANGTFTLADVPPGTYEVAAWHERFGKVERQVVVRAGGSVAVELSMRAGSVSGAH